MKKHFNISVHHIEYQIDFLLRFVQKVLKKNKHVLNVGICNINVKIQLYKIYKRTSPCQFWVKTLVHQYIYIYITALLALTFRILSLILIFSIHKDEHSKISSTKSFCHLGFYNFYIFYTYIFLRNYEPRKNTGIIRNGRMLYKLNVSTDFQSSRTCLEKEYLLPKKISCNWLDLILVS